MARKADILVMVEMRCHKIRNKNAKTTNATNVITADTNHFLSTKAQKTVKIIIATIVIHK